MAVGTNQLATLASAVSPGDSSMLSGLLAEVREAALVSRLAELGRGAYAWRTVDDDLAALTLDSACDPAPAWRSQPDEARVLVFTSDPIAVELEITGSRVVGQIIPPGPGQIVVEKEDGVTVRAVADDVGFFDLPERPRGRFRLRCETPTGRLITDWLCL